MTSSSSARGSPAPRPPCCSPGTARGSCSLTGLGSPVTPAPRGLVMVYMAAPLAEFSTFRSDIEGNYLAALDSCGDLGERARGGVRAERLRTTPDQPNTFRASHGPGWALVGDAGVVMDSISAQGITNALRDAELLAEAIAAGLGGSRPLTRRSPAATRSGSPADVRLHLRAGPVPPPEPAPAPAAQIAGRPPGRDRPVHRRLRGGHP